MSRFKDGDKVKVTPHHVRSFPRMKGVTGVVVGWKRNSRGKLLGFIRVKFKRGKFNRRTYVFHTKFWRKP